MTAGTPFRAILLAGGRGTRLAPYTFVLPKPLLPIGERPILDLVLNQLARAGCGRATICVGYLGHLIETFCGDGERWGVAIDYFREDSPLGTVGALGRLADLPEEPFVVMNGDVLTDLDHRALLSAHAAAGADLTIAAFSRTVRDELGILETDSGDRLVAYREKPEHEYLVSTGVYVFSPPTAHHFERSGTLDFPDLVQRLLDAGRHVHVHRHEGYWLDIGRPDDFARANEEFARVFGGSEQGRPDDAVSAVEPGRLDSSLGEAGRIDT